jgi:BirA family biotin operon repressor/biotin-[acetyl-CoA-carboxylase] ligase
MDRIHFVILGIGVNLNVDEKTFSKEIQAIATSLKIETGQTISRKAFLRSLLWGLERWYSIFLKEGNANILKAWRERAQIEGREIRVTSFGETIVGTGIDVDSDGALILETEDGKRKRIVAGDVEYRR